jgi:hypothetical protein
VVVEIIGLPLISSQHCSRHISDNRLCFIPRVRDGIFARDTYRLGPAIAAN